MRRLKSAKRSEVIHRLEQLGLSQDAMTGVLGYSKQHILNFRSHRNSVLLNESLASFERLELGSPKSFNARGLKLVVDALVLAMTSVTKLND